MGFKDSMITVEVIDGVAGTCLNVDLPPNLERHYFSVSAVDILGNAIDIFGEKLDKTLLTNTNNIKRREIQFLAEGIGGAWFHVGDTVVSSGSIPYLEQPCIKGQYFSGSCIASGFQVGDKITLRVASYL